MTTDPGGGAANETTSVSAGEESPDATASRRVIEPDLLWTMRITERLLGTAGRPASWERPYFEGEPPVDDEDAPVSVVPQPIREPARPNTAAEVYVQPAEVDEAAFRPIDPRQQLGTPAEPETWSAPAYAPRVEAAAPTAPPPLRPARPASVSRPAPAPEPLPRRQARDFDGPVSYRQPPAYVPALATMPEEAPVADVAAARSDPLTDPLPPYVPEVSAPAFADTTGSMTPEPAARDLPTETAETTEAPVTPAATALAPDPAQAAAHDAASGESKTEMPAAVLRAALRDALPDDLLGGGRRLGGPADAVFHDPRWSLPPEDEAPVRPRSIIDLDDPLWSARPPADPGPVAEAPVTEAPVAEAPVAAADVEPVVEAVPDVVPEVAPDVVPEVVPQLDAPAVAAADAVEAVHVEPEPVPVPVSVPVEPVAAPVEVAEADEIPAPATSYLPSVAELEVPLADTRAPLVQAASAAHEEPVGYGDDPAALPAEVWTKAAGPEAGVGALYADALAADLAEESARRAEPFTAEVADGSAVEIADGPAVEIADEPAVGIADEPAAGIADAGTADDAIEPADDVEPPLDELTVAEEPVVAAPSSDGVAAEAAVDEPSPARPYVDPVVTVLEPDALHAEDVAAGSGTAELADGAGDVPVGPTDDVVETPSDLAAERDAWAGTVAERAALGFGYPRPLDQLEASDVALRRAFLSGDIDLAEAVVRLVGEQSRDRQRIRTVEAYLDALLDEGGQALVGAARLRRVLGD